MAEFEHLIDTHIRLFDALWRAREGTVMTDITTQMGQGNKHLPGVADYIAVALITQAAGRFSQSGGIRAFSQGKCFGSGERLA